MKKIPHPRNFGVTKGFTLIELLVVIAVIGILAAVIMASLSSARTKARTSAVQQEQAQIVKAIMAARITSGRTLQGITGSGYSEGACVALGAVDLRNISTSSGCYTAMLSAFTAIDTASGGMLQPFIGKQIRDIWGSPYMFDENEGESLGNPCANDILRSAGPNGIRSDSDDINTLVPLSLSQCS